MKHFNWIMSVLASLGTIVLFVIVFWSSMNVEEFINRPFGRNYEKGAMK